MKTMVIAGLLIMAAAFGWLYTHDTRIDWSTARVTKFYDNVSTRIDVDHADGSKSTFVHSGGWVRYPDGHAVESTLRPTLDAIEQRYKWGMLK